MATIVNVPRDTRFGELGAGISSAYGTGAEKKRKEDQRKELSAWIQKAQQSPDRETLLRSPIPAAFEGSQGALQYSSLIEAIHPRDMQNFVRPTDPDSTDPRSLEFVGRFASGSQPEGTIPLDAARLMFKVPPGGKGTKSTPAGLKFRTLQKLIANDRAAAEGKRPPHKMTSTENRLVQSEFSDPTWQAAVKIASESREYFKLKTAKERNDFVLELRTQIESGGDLSKIMKMPPGITNQDIKAIMKNPNQKGKTEDQILKQLWDRYNAGTRF